MPGSRRVMLVAIAGVPSSKFRVIPVAGALGMQPRVG